VERDERRRAGGVDRHGRAVHAEDVRQTAGSNARRVAGADVGFHPRQIAAARLQVQVIVARDADEDAGLRAEQAVDRLPRVLERLPAHLEQQPLLRVERRRFARGDAEEVGIEPIQAVEEAPAARVHLPGFLWILAEEPIDVPAVGRDLARRVDAVAQQLPERFRIVRTARHAATHADNRDRLGLLLLGPIELRAQLHREQRELLGRQLGDSFEKLVHL